MDFWLIFGFCGQITFASRFYVQWIASEKARKSVVPVLFWYLSIVGSLILLIYSIYKQDPVFIVGQSTGFLIYSRNLFFVHKEKQNLKKES